jgi:predicted nucleic acid-binding protein
MSVFADAVYWIALLHPRERLYAKAREASAALADDQIVTSEMVLVEMLNAFASEGEQLRNAASSFVERLQSNPRVSIVPQSSAQFQQALSLYQRRRDKNWSLTDCASFLIMQKQKISEALTHDRHFQQAGFRALLRED